MAKRAAIYARVSVDRDLDKATIERQVEQCQALCAAREWSVVETFEERNISAFKRGVHRPQYDAMQQGITEGRFDAVVAYKLDRLSRSVSQALKLSDLCDAHGCDLVIVHGAIDTSTAQGRAFFVVSAAFGELEAATTSERTKGAEETNAAKGLVPTGGKRCYGYVNKGKDRGAIISDEKAHIRRAAQDVLDGHSLRETTRRLNDSGSRTTMGNEWSPRSLKKLLMSPRLRGKRDHLGSLTDGVWEPIFSEDEHTRLIRALDNANAYKASPDRVVNRHLLTGLAFCGVCGHRLAYGRTKKGDRVTSRYACKPAPGSDACGGLSVAEDPLDRYVILVVNTFGTTYVEQLQERRVTVAHRLEALTEELEITRQQLDALYQDKYRPGALMSDEVYASLRVPLEDHIDELDAELGRLGSELERLPERTTSQFIRGSRQHLAGTVPEQRTHLRKFLESVIVNKARHRGGRFDPGRVVLHWLSGDITNHDDLRIDESDWDAEKETWNAFNS